MVTVKQLVLKYKRLILYYMVGAVNTLVDFLVYSGVFFLTKLPVPSQAAGYMVGVVSSFCLNRGITFRGEGDGSPILQFVKFMAVNLVSLLVSMAGIHLLADIWRLNGYLSKIPVCLITSVINYVGYRLFVFKKKEPENEQD